MWDSWHQTVAPNVRTLLHELLVTLLLIIREITRGEQLRVKMLENTEDRLYSISSSTFQ